MSSAAEKSLYRKSSHAEIIENDDFNSKSPSKGSEKFMGKWLVGPKMLYFGSFFCLYAMHSFLTQFIMKTWNLSKNEVLGTPAIFLFANVFGSILIPLLADRTKKSRFVLAFCIAGHCSAMCLLLKPLFQNIEQNIYMKLYYYLINSIGAFFLSGALPLIDSMVLNKLSSNPMCCIEMFGRQRVWGMFGKAAAGWIVHQLYNLAGQDFKVMFYTMIVSGVLVIVAIFLIDLNENGIETALKSPEDAEKPNNSVSQKRIGYAKSSLITKPCFMFFLGTIFIAYLIRYILIFNKHTYIRFNLNLNRIAASNSLFLGAILEILLFVFSKELCQRFGVYKVLVTGYSAGVACMLGYCLIPKAEIADSKPSAFVAVCIMMCELIKSAGSPLIISSTAQIAHGMAIIGNKAIAQGLVAASSSLASIIVISALLGLADFGSIYLLGSIIGALFIIAISLKFALVDRIFSKKDQD
jgi:hypothetical protein